MQHGQTVKQGLKTGLETTWVLGKIIFPVTLVVTLLQFTPVIDWIIALCEPFMGYIGLGGEAAIPLVLANVLNLYAGIGAILTIDLTVKEVFILAVMMSFSHNLFIESAVAVKVGIKFWVVLAVRIGLAVVSAFFINLFWLGGNEKAQYGFVPSSTEAQVSGWWDISLHALEAAAIGVLQLAVIVIPLMVFIQYMKDLQFLDVFSRWMRPFTRLLGLSPNTSTTLGAGLLFGLAFGAGVILQQVKEERISKKDMYLLFIFLVACHAVIEDTLIFVPLGIPVLPLLIIRLVVAILLTMTVAYIWNRLEKQRAPEYDKHEGVQHEI